MSTPTLPAVVLGIDTPIGLTVVRDLGSHGVPVYGIARSPTALGMHSRFLRRGLVRPGTPDGLIDQIVALGQELGQACLFVISEGDIAFVNRHRDRLGNFKCLFADTPRLESVLDKAQTYVAADKVGIRTPRTAIINRMEQAEALRTTLRFPVVLKWANPHDAARLLAPFKVTPEKTHYCQTPDELIDYLRRFEPAGTYPLIQEYVAGNGLGQFVLMKDGQAHYTFQHYREHEWPPEGGSSSLCESIPADQHRELMAKSIALLRELGWEGVAMVEYRYDPATGEAALMEINGRFWGSLPLAYHAGANFPYLYYRLFGLGLPVDHPPYRAGVRCRYMVPETKRLARVLFAPHKIPDRKVSFKRVPELLGYLADFVRPHSRYFVFDRRDPQPFLHDLGQMLGKVVGKRGAKRPAPAPARLTKDGPGTN
jgi:predicted ATP-grasp superfamily ATP-dependent carboligase